MRQKPACICCLIHRILKYKKAANEPELSQPSSAAHAQYLAISVFKLDMGDRDGNKSWTFLF